MAKTERDKTGQIGEGIACTFLKRRSFKIIERNYRKPWGEIDIIAEKCGIVHFVEVKSISVDIKLLSRESSSYTPEEMATSEKLRKVAKTATLYMESKKDNREYQIDVVGVLLDKKNKIAKCRIFEQALEENL